MATFYEVKQLLCRLFGHRDIEDNDDDITVLVGPEGDFSIDEVRMAMDNGFVSASLGKSRLRTETAGLSAVMMSQLARRL